MITEGVDIICGKFTNFNRFFISDCDIDEKVFWGITIIKKVNKKRMNFIIITTIFDRDFE